MGGSGAGTLGLPSPTSLDANTRNWYLRAGLKPPTVAWRALAGMEVLEVCHVSGVSPGKQGQGHMVL